ncbi:carboxylesterase [Heterostelium album PN500]|uniref:Carboxylic ester hydrolase n=1 Tax=Heterostelium pallidum (strain ATCC 26659 / Pp 5 / PN500) TaxID=670386 RepID=D3B0X9_HETP5|nr:carboxylesterase [Heterostelium album PN500]EFA84953.1 carboxylesterase [Heterostelium album PN500]|eukprot:XP_020437063.1 carboxylesterase [Heterostelium album PN500]
MFLKLISVLLIVSLAYVANGQQSAPLTVSARSGVFTGIYFNSTRAFLGVPYAKPPVGSLRFEQPQPRDYIFGTYQATTHAPSCWQSGKPAGYVYSEDCLYMDIYTPKGYSRNSMPVLVFIHGGRYWTGAATDFPGDKLAAIQKAVVVIIQYRLNVFGFQPFSDSNNNLGLQDQQLALRFVRDNIRAFGGDPSQVTIFGESAGGSSVLHHTIIPSSFSLYNNAIIQSAWQWYIPTVAQGRTKMASWAATKGCDGTTDIITCLKTKNATDITPTAGQSDFFVPMVDGKLITSLPLKAIKEKRYNYDATIMMGHNYDEGNFMAYSRLGWVPPNVTVTDATYNTSIAKYLNVYFNSSQVTDIMNLYAPVAAQLGNWYGGAEFFGDYYIVCGSILASQYFKADRVEAYYYLFNYSSPNYPANEWFLAASHGNELPYIFFQDIYTPYPFANSDNLLASRMSSAWVDFADNDSPRSPLSDWPTNYPQAMYYGPNASDFKATKPYTKDICENWRQYFEAY